MNANTLDDVYAFWFGDCTVPNEERLTFWMHQNDATDEAVRERFGCFLPSAAKIDWDLTALTRQQCVALVVLFDQFPRNIFRTSGEAFAYDDIARDLTRRLTAGGWDHFTAAERFFLALPYVHHEDLADQDFAVMLSSEVTVRAPDDLKALCRGDLDQAIRHREVISRFGRFPHRNVMLGRESTPEEIEFLATALRGRGF
jgi:uncharacterized protein (DUF924 family)